MSELTKEYFDEKLDELLRTVKVGFDATASRTDLQEVKKDVSNLTLQVSQLTQ